MPAGWIADFNMTHRRSPAPVNKPAPKKKTADHLAAEALSAVRRRKRAERAAKQDISTVLAVLVTTFLLVTGVGIGVGIYLINSANQPLTIQQGSNSRRF